MQRRQFITHMLGGAAALGLGSSIRINPALAQASVAYATFLNIVKRNIEVNGKAASVFGLVQDNGVSGLFLDAEKPFNVRLLNKIDASTLVHWHGLTPPWEQDGVPDNPVAPLGAGESRDYQFPLTQGGTFWMHAHSLQEQNLLAAPLIVRTAGDRQRDEQEVTILLHDFSFKSPEELLAGLQGGGHGGAMTAHGGHGSHGGAPMDMPMDMPMNHDGAMDLNDIEYDAYLANDRTLDDPEVVQVEKGGRLRLRIINGATATGFTIDTGALEAELVAVDGQDIAPIKGRRFPLAMGQRVDLRLAMPDDGQAHAVLALREGASERTGVILAPAGAKISRLASTAEEKGPILDLALERKLVPLRQPARKEATRKFDISLMGDMMSYQWAMSQDLLDVSKGERIEATLRNKTMMSHPMHLHGHHFQVVGIDGQRFDGAVRDTVLVPVNSSVTIAFDAENSGRWPLHCHHLYHMATGMMAFVRYA